MPDPAPLPEDDLARSVRLVEALAQTWRQAGRDVRILQTHISTLVLVDNEVYKFKKPLRLDFLDFRSLHARRQACLDELRLNRRTAPHWYLGVCPILGSPEAPVVGTPETTGGGPVLEWVLHMRRFDDALTLDTLAAQGRLTPEHIDAMAQVTATLHHIADTTPSTAPDAPRDLDGVERAGRWAQDNLQSLRRSPAGILRSTELQALVDWTQERFQALRPRMTRRAGQGRIRECHGDLHLGNWVLLNGQPTPFDALEFNAELRWIDVVSDLAFPVMDLLARGQDRLAWRLANGWFERTGDYEGAALLSWFLVYRALVRAKVNWLQAAPSHDALAHRHFDLAVRLSHPDRPWLIAVSGLSGSGKSTVAQSIAEHCGGLRLRSDVERKRLHGLQALDRPAGPLAAQMGAVPRETLYSREATVRTYARLHAVASQLLADGVTVVVDAASLRPEERSRLRALGAGAGVPVLSVWCAAPPAVLHARVSARTQRGDDASDADTAVLERQLQWAQAPTGSEAADTWRLDTDVDRATLDARVASGLTARRPSV